MTYSRFWVGSSTIVALLCITILVACSSGNGKGESSGTGGSTSGNSSTPDGASAGGSGAGSSVMAGTAGISMGGESGGSGGAFSGSGGSGSGGASLGTGGGPDTGSGGSPGGAGGGAGNPTGGHDAGPGGASAGDASAPSQNDGGLAYSPCASKSMPCRIMPLGDSITQGYRSSDGGGYRVELFHASLGDKKNITFVGSQTSGPAKVDGVAFPMSHEGHGGYTIAGGAGDGGPGIQPSVVSWMSAAKPDIVTLMIGTNDVNNLYAWQTQSAAELTAAPTRLGKLMDTILAEDAHVLLLVAQITPTTIDAENTLVKTYNDAIPALVKARADAGKHIFLVDMYTPFVSTSNYQTTLLRGTSDSLHPADAGYKKMGDIWYASLKSILP